jgi:CheY-like chemotaxis protein
MFCRCGKTKSSRFKFAVKDTGIGISPESQSRSFNLSCRLMAQPRGRFGGTGLGLAICKQLVELMHGDIGFESTAGKGSVFWFTVPLEKQPEQEQTPPMASTLEGYKILVVDDNSTNRDIVHHQALSWKMRNGSAQSGSEALKILLEAARANDPYDVAILDMQMPEMDGLALARAIKADPVIASTQLIMLTSLGYLPEERKWRDAGITAYLVKPVKEGRLYDTLVTVLRGTARAARGADASRESGPERTAVRSAGGRGQYGAIRRSLCANSRSSVMPPTPWLMGSKCSKRSSALTMTLSLWIARCPNWTGTKRPAFSAVKKRKPAHAVII